MIFIGTLLLYSNYVRRLSCRESTASNPGETVSCSREMFQSSHIDAVRLDFCRESM